MAKKGDKKSSEKNVSKKNIPLGLKILVILDYIGSALAILGGIVFILFSFFADSIFQSQEVIQELANKGISAEEMQVAISNLPTLMITFGILFLIVGIINIFIARGLWKGKNWARIITLIFSSLGIVMGLLNLFMGNFISLVGLIINGIVAWYLGFNKNIKNYFE